jgi:hypothetical protein
MCCLLHPINRFVLPSTVHTVLTLQDIFLPLPLSPDPAFYQNLCPKTVSQSQRNGSCYRKHMTVVVRTLLILKHRKQSVARMVCWVSQTKIRMWGPLPGEQWNRTTKLMHFMGTKDNVQEPSQRNSKTSELRHVPCGSFLHITKDCHPTVAYCRESLLCSMITNTCQTTVWCLEHQFHRFSGRMWKDLDNGEPRKACNFLGNVDTEYLSCSWVSLLHIHHSRRF